MDRNGIREASVIVAPPDTCPNCQREHVHAWTTLYSPADNAFVNGQYRCPSCAFVWDQTWRIEPR